jgi:serine/threonine-protein kinase
MADSIAGRHLSASGEVLAPEGILDGRFRLRHQIAVTRLSIVYRAVDLISGRGVIVKVARRASRDSAQILRAEAQSLRRVGQAGLPGARHVASGQISGQPFLVMTYVPGYTLAWLAENGWIGGRRAAEAVLDVAQYVEEVHLIGLVHHDIKPANIIVRPDGIPVLIDWGSACAFEGLASNAVWTLTPEFTSEEQVRGEIWPSNDVYALGRTLEELLPWPQRLVRAVIGCATARHGVRYSSAEAFARALRRLLALDSMLRACGVAGLFKQGTE